MAKGERISPGVYRDPRTGKKYNSETGALPKSGGSNRNTGGSKPRGFLADAPALKKDLGQVMKNPAEMIEGQLGANQFSFEKNIQGNRVNEAGPVGETQYIQNPDGSYTKRTSLSQGQQGILNQYERGQTAVGAGMADAATQASQKLQQGYNYNGLPNIPGQNDLLGERRRVEDTMMNRFDERVNPQFQRETQQLEQTLMDRGLMPGTAQYKQQMDDLYRRQQDSRRDYQVSAVQQGGQEMQSNFGMGLQGRQQAVSEYDTQFFAPQRSMAGFSQSFQGPMMPNPEPTAVVNYGNVDVGGAVGQFQNYDIQKKQVAKMGSGGGGGGGGGYNYNGALMGMLTQAPPTVQPGPTRQSPANSFASGFGSGATMGAYRRF